MKTISDLLAESESNGFGAYMAKLQVEKRSCTKAEFEAEMRNWTERSLEERDALLQAVSARADLITQQRETAQANYKPRKCRKARSAPQPASQPSRSQQALESRHSAIDGSVNEVVHMVTSRYVTIPLAVKLTGLTVAGIRGKIQRQQWMDGRQYRKGPDGRIYMDLQAYERWVLTGK